jgi:hypothetical protein
MGHSHIKQMLRYFPDYLPYFVFCDIWHMWSGCVNKQKNQVVARSESTLRFAIRPLLPKRLDLAVFGSISSRS